MCGGGRAGRAAEGRRPGSALLARDLVGGMEQWGEIMLLSLEPLIF